MLDKEKRCRSGDTLGPRCEPPITAIPEKNFVSIQREAQSYGLHLLWEKEVPFSTKASQKGQKSGRAMGPGRNRYSLQPYILVATCTVFLFFFRKFVCMMHWLRYSVRIETAKIYEMSPEKHQFDQYYYGLFFKGK